MQTVAPLITALIAAALAVSVLIRDRRNRVYRRYAIFAAIVAVVFLCMFFYVHTRQPFWRYGVLLGGLLVAPASLQVYHLVLRRYRPATGVLSRVLFGAAVIQGVVVILFARRFDPIHLLNGAVVFAGLLANLVVLFRVQRGIEQPVDKARLRTLAYLGTGAFGLLLTEMVIQAYNLEAGGFFGIIPFPPVGTLATAVYIYFLGQVILLYRLLALHELIAQLANFVVMSILLAGVYAVLVLWPGSGTSLVASVVNTLMATAVMLILYSPLRESIDRWTVRVFFKERYQVERAVERLIKRLPGIFQIDALVDELLTSLTGSGRVQVASVFLWNDEDRAYRLAAHAGDHSMPELQRVPSRPFAEGLLRGRSPVLRENFRRQAQHNLLLPPPRTEGDSREREWQEAALHTMEGMGADVTMPFLSGRSVLGWLNLRCEAGAVGFTRAEIELIGRVVERAAAGIDNSRQFERMKDRDRLAALGEMSAGLAHEIRNPLGAIKGAAQVIQEQSADDQGSEFVRIIVEEVDRLNTVVSQFLDYARPMQLDRDPVSLGPVLRNTVRMIDTDGVPDGVTIDLDLADELPPVPADVEKLRQVLLNLVRNGLEAMQGGGELRISARHHRALRRVRPLGSTGNQRRLGALINPLAGAIEISIEDQGDGISPEDLSRLFIPFYTTKNAGNGLGLPICERIIRAHGGELDIQSRTGEGARFVVRLPMDPEASSEGSSHSLETVGIR